MTLFSKLAVASALVLAIAAPVAFAQTSELRPIGEVQFEPEPSQVQTDLFQIRPEDRRIRSMRIQADEGSADVRSLLVNYADGGQERVRVR
jgi:hypothetical protein